MTNVQWLEVKLDVMVRGERLETVATAEHVDVHLAVTKDGRHVGDIRLSGESAERLLEQLQRAVWEASPGRRVTIDESAFKSMQKELSVQAQEIERLEAEATHLREAIKSALAVSSNRQAFVMQGPRAFAKAERILQDALEPSGASGGRIAELEAKVKRLQTRIGESVLPLELDDGTRIFASAISGGADYVDGMPRQVSLVARDAEGYETERQYVQADVVLLKFLTWAHEQEGMELRTYDGERALQTATEEDNAKRMIDMFNFFAGGS